MKLITKEEILSREGWTDEKIQFFLGKKIHLSEGSGYVLSKVYRSENSDIFKNFTTIEEAQKLKDKIETSLKENTNEAIARFSEKIPKVNETVSLLKNIKKYKEDNSISKEIIHFINKEKINSEEKFDLFTDGSLKIEGGKNIIACSGWIRNQNGEPILEFVKNIDEKSVSSFYDFEIFGLEMGLKIVQSLGIKNVHVYSDSNGEMKTLNFMKEGFITERMLDLPEVYFPINEIIKEINIKFSYIPREFNDYADTLSKIYIDEHKENLKIILEEQKKTGYDYQNTEAQYYTNTKIENLKDLKQEGVLFVQRYIEKNFYQFYIDMKQKEILSVEVLPIKETKKLLLEERMIFKENFNGMDAIQLALLTREISKNNEKGNKHFNVVHPSLGIKCRIENIVMVTNEWKEHYINLDKEINKMDKIFFHPLTDELIKITKNWISQNNIKENNKNLKLLK